MSEDSAFTAMSNGEWYYDSEVTTSKRNSTRLALQKNNLEFNNEVRIQNIKNLLENVGVDFFVETNFEFSFGENISIGDHFYANRNVILCDEAKITIGNNCKFGPGTSLLTPFHPIDPVKRQTKIEISKPISIGNNVWLGGNVTILPGISIGNNVVVGAGSVVTKSFPDNVIIVGNPARILRKTTDS